MMNKVSIYRTRLLQIRGNLVTEGWRQTGSLGDSVIAFKHTNGNRLTLIANEESIAYIKNGKLVKQEALRAATVLPSATPTT